MSKKNHIPTFSSRDFQILDQTIVYDGYFKMKKLKFRFRLYQGEWSEVIEREVFERGDSVAVLPFDPIREEIILIEQFRLATIRNDESQSPWLLELIAGVVEKNEKTTDVALREAKEEAGLKIEKLFYLCDYWPSPGGTSEKVTLYGAIIDLDSQKISLDKFYGLKEESENIKVLNFKIKEAINLLKENKIKNAHTIIALQWLEINYFKLRENFLNKKIK